jgi:glycosyltransferase involved in cell wall biosynthesis
MTAGPRVVLGMPVYNRPDALAEALESVLGQTYRDFALVILDDTPSDATAEVVKRYCHLDPRITYERNPVRLGMIANWRKCFDRGRALYPGSEYFAWLSDHDAWHPRWLEVLHAELGRDRNLVLVYPCTVRTLTNAPPTLNRSFETVGVVRPEDRLRLSASSMTAGNMIYGLFRASALERAGVFRSVLMPDRQVLLELALYGQFKQVRYALWYREIGRGFSSRRQRAAFFPRGAPLYTYLPTHLTHFGTLLWDFSVRGRGRPTFGRLTGFRYACLQLSSSLKRELKKLKAAFRAGAGPGAIGQHVSSGFSASGHRVRQPE